MCGRYMRVRERAARAVLGPRRRGDGGRLPRQPALLRAHARLGAAPSRVHAAGDRAHRRADGAALYVGAERASCRCRTPASWSAPRRPSPDISFTAMEERQRAVVDVLLADPAVATVLELDRRRLSGWSSMNRGWMTLSLKPLAERGDFVRSGDRPAARAVGQGRRRADLPVLGAGFARRRTPGRLAIPVRHDHAEPRRAALLGAGAGGSAEGHAGHRRCQLRPGPRRAAGERGDRPRCRGAARASGPPTSTTR